MDQRAVFSVNEVAKILGLSRNSAYEGVRRGEIPCIRVGKRLLIPRHAIEVMLSQYSDKASKPEN